MKTDEQFYHYFRKAQDLAIKAHHDIKAREDLLRLIEQEKENAHENLTFERFLQGEHAFFSRKYPHALKCYLRAQAAPYFKLFCYRTSAFVSKGKGEIGKALNFAKQALNIYPYDYVTLAIYEELLTLENQEEEASNIRQRLQTLEAQHTSTKISEIENRLEEEVQTEEQLIFAEPLDGHAIKEVIMPIPCDFLTSPKSAPSSNTEALTQRLYSTTAPDDVHLSKFNPIAFEELKRLSEVHQPKIDSAILAHPLSDSSTHSDPKKALEDSIQKFSAKYHENITQYLETHKKQSTCQNNCLYLLHGRPSGNSDTQSLLLEKNRRTTGGYYLRWNNKGIVINPGSNFLTHFHHQGLHIRDIDAIIVTSSQQEMYVDIKDIYELNYQINKVGTAAPHIIHYYLNPLAHQTLSTILKPNFKQERNTIHRLETFQDSPDAEKIDIAENIVLHYFPSMQTKQQTLRNGKEDRVSQPSHLGMRLDLHTRISAHEKKTTSLGYVSGISWSPLLAHSLGACDILIAGFGSTNSNDFNKLRYNEDCLGYFGCYSLLEEVHPQLFVCSEFNGSEGDIRLDIVKLMRHEYGKAYPNMQKKPIVLPADSNLFIQLNTLNVFCSLTKESVPADNIRVAKSSVNFGALQFLSPSCCS